MSKLASMKKHVSSYFALAALAPMLLAAQAPADLVLTNGRIYTVDNARPIVTALAVRGARIAFVGSDAEALVSPSTRLIDLHGAIVVPGIVDAHGHLLGLGHMLETANVAGSNSYDEGVDRLRSDAQAGNPGAWIL